MIPLSSIASTPMLDQAAVAAGNRIEQPQEQVANRKVALDDAATRRVQDVTSDAHAGAGGPGGLLDRTA